MATAGSHAQVDEEVADKLIAGFKRGIDSSDADEQVAVILALKDADCSQAADYLLKVLDEDDIVLKIAVYETLKSYKNPETLETIIKKGLMSRKAEVRRWSAVSLGYMPDPAPEAAAMLLKTLKKERHPGAKAAEIRALGRLKAKEAGELILKEIGDKDAVVRMECAYALSRIQPDGTLEAIAGLLTDPVWQVRVQAVERLDRFNDPRIIPFLIKRLPRENGRLREDILSKLCAITGQDFGLDYERWDGWWSDNEDSFIKEFGGKKTRRYKKPKYAEGYSYYNITTYSKNFIFVLDVSGSMTETILPAKSYGYGLKQIPRINLAKQQLIKLIETLGEDTAFNIVYFAGFVTEWKDSLQSGTKRNKDDAVDFVNNIQCIERGKIMAVTTNLYTAMDSVLKMAEDGFAKKSHSAAADTVFLLSDGVPTGPDWLTDREAIAFVLRERNRYLKMRIHTISLAGDMETPRFLLKLSEPNGGELKNVLRE